MKNILISGPDGTGKSTISSGLHEYYTMQDIDTKTTWLRFSHYLAKLVNVLGRLSGKSYYEKYPWGKVGYHDYRGLIGYLYIFAVYVDHIIFRLFFRDNILSNDSADLLIVDRYILDIMADLIVDTGRYDLVLSMFSSFANKELKFSKIFILKCDPEIVFLRREDIKDDKSYEKKRKAYSFLAKNLGIKELDTGILTIEEVIGVITAT